MVRALRVREGKVGVVDSDIFDLEGEGREGNSPFNLLIGILGPMLLLGDAIFQWLWEGKGREGKGRITLVYPRWVLLLDVTCSGFSL